jgi:hypothetical protein
MATVTSNPTDQEDDITRCAHPGCDCKVEPDQKYCSAECEKQLNGEPCTCGHSNCQHEHEGLS